MGGLFKEFRSFAVKGNVIDLAVGVIIGAAFGKIVTSLVQDIINPPLGLVIGKVDFSNLHVTLKKAAVANGQTQPAVTVNYGNFLNVLVQFVITAFAIFLLVKAINAARDRIEPEKPIDAPVTKQCRFCLSDIPPDAIKCKFCTSDLTDQT